jgi:NAD kinase
MREHRHNDDRIQSRMHNRATCRQRVGCRTRGTRHDQAVGTLIVNELIVKPQRELHHAHNAARTDDHIVECALLGDHFTVS